MSDDTKDNAVTDRTTRKVRAGLVVKLFRSLGDDFEVAHGYLGRLPGWPRRAGCRTLSVAASMRRKSGSWCSNCRKTSRCCCC